MSNPINMGGNVPDLRAVLTVAERASVLRCCRQCRDNLRMARDHMRTQHKLGDRHADDAARVLDAELTILEAAIKTLWKQSGAEPPPGE